MLSQRRNVRREVIVVHSVLCAFARKILFIVLITDSSVYKYKF
jgi:hypothetical protein